MTLPVAHDFKAEADELFAFLQTLTDEDWVTPTRFMEWTPWDILAHLHYFDEVSLHSAEGEEAFASRRKILMDSVGSGMSTTELQRREFAGLDAKSLLARWKSTCDDLANRLGELNPKSRLPWFGPDMGASMFTTARYMETWAHAQAIYDTKQAPRVHSDRIRNIVAIGVKTFGWTFVNRKLEIPGPPPHVILTAPSGQIWEYNVPEASGVPESADARDGDAGIEQIRGDAVDFCFTVTQVRNVLDTGLVVKGPIAERWMEIAQCFAGAAVDPPAPGARLGQSD